MITSDKKEKLQRIMPENDLDARSSPRAIGELIGKLQTFQSDPEKIQRMYPWASRFVCGMPLASWQRVGRWSVEMQMDFIDSIWRGSDLGGSYMVNGWYDMKDTPDGIVMEPLSDIVLDGQQRLMSIQRYLLNEIPAKGQDGSLIYYKDLPRYEQLRFSNSTFPQSTVNSNDEQKLRAIYDKRNFSGIQHKESERALICSSEAYDINKKRRFSSVAICQSAQTEGRSPLKLLSCEDTINHARMAAANAVSQDDPAFYLVNQSRFRSAADFDSLALPGEYAVIWVNAGIHQQWMKGVREINEYTLSEDGLLFVTEVDNTESIEIGDSACSGRNAETDPFDECVGPGFR